MAISMQSKCVSARSTVSKASPRCVRVEAAHGAVERVQMVAASFAAAALLMAPMADAGVILTKPQRSFKAFQSSNKPSATPQAAPSPAAPKPEGPTFGPLGFDARTVGLPGSIGFIAVLALVASKVDGQFDEFMKATLIKDNNLGEAGLGYEEVIKSTYGGIYGEVTASGTKKGKAGKKKGLFPFGKK